MSKVSSATAALFERELVARNKALVEKWSPVLDSEKAPAIEGEVNRYVMAQMLENTNRELKDAMTTTAFGTAYVPTMMGMTRQVFPRLVGLDLVSVQPMSLPTGKVFHLKVTRDDESDVANFAQWDASKAYADHTTGEATQIQKGMKFGITSSDISIGTPKKLYVEASVELLQDLRAYHNLDASELLQSAAVDEITRELDGQLISAVRAAAIANRTFTFGQVAPTGYTKEEWRHHLQDAFLEADNHVYEESGQATTFMACGSKAALELMKLRSFQIDPAFTGNSESAGYGIQRLGTVNAQWSVFRSRYLPANEIIVGRKGSSILDSGVFYLPYVPLMISERSFNNRTQTVDQSFMSRYGIHTVSTDYYTRIVIDPTATGLV